jgi:hypothetical protein
MEQAGEKLQDCGGKELESEDALNSALNFWRFS